MPEMPRRASLLLKELGARADPKAGRPDVEAVRRLDRLLVELGREPALSPSPTLALPAGWRLEYLTRRRYRSLRQVRRRRETELPCAACDGHDNVTATYKPKESIDNAPPFGSNPSGRITQSREVHCALCAAYSFYEFEAET